MPRYAASLARSAWPARILDAAPVASVPATSSRSLASAGSRQCGEQTLCIVGAMKRHGFIAIVFLIGCATGGVASQLVVPPARAGTNPTRWEYLCSMQEEGNMTAELNHEGAQGWELVSVVPRRTTGFGGRLNSFSFYFCSLRALYLF